MSERRYTLTPEQQRDVDAEIARILALPPALRAAAENMLGETFAAAVKRCEQELAAYYRDVLFAAPKDPTP